MNDECVSWFINITNSRNVRKEKEMQGKGTN